MTLFTFRNRLKVEAGEIIATPVDPVISVDAPNADAALVTYLESKQPEAGLNPNDQGGENG